VVPIGKGKSKGVGGIMSRLKIGAQGSKVTAPHPFHPLCWYESTRCFHITTCGRSTNYNLEFEDQFMFAKCFPRGLKAYRGGRSEEEDVMKSRGTSYPLDLQAF
jgi:hypothetical protein